jgi:hypothetical protein
MRDNPGGRREGLRNSDGLNRKKTTIRALKSIAGMAPVIRYEAFQT